MKKIKNIIFTLLVIVLTQTIAFAQDPPPSDFGTSSTPADSNATDAPIDTYVWLLLLVGLLYVCSKYRTRKHS